MKKVKKRPKAEHFSNKELVKLFDHNLKRQINKLNKLSQLEKDYFKELELLLKLLANNLKQKEFSSIRKKIKRLSPYYDSILRLQYRKRVQLNEFFRKRKENICWKSGCTHRIIQYGHVLSKRYFSRRRRGFKKLENFGDNIFNLVPICSNHHELFDERRGKNTLSSTDIKRIISKKKTFNRKLEKMLDKEIKYYSGAIEKFSKKRKGLELYEKNIYNMLRRWNKFS